jgi:hypothetical protein
LLRNEEVPMPLIQGGPPEWIWERSPCLLKWEVVPSPASNGHPSFELRVQCGLEILRFHFFTLEELGQLRDAIQKRTDKRPNAEPLEPVHPGPEPGVQPEREPGNTPETPEADRPPQRKREIVSDPDFAGRH